MSMGFQMNADPAHAELSRLSPDGMTMETVPVNALAILEGRASDIALRPGDRLVVPVLPVMAVNAYVTVEGEVKKPGTYPITRDGTKLSDIIRQAGGFSERVNLNGGLVYRPKVGEIDASLLAERERLLSLRASLSFQDTSYYHVESMLRLKEEQVVVDFLGLFVRGDSTCDITLRAHDRIVIPGKQHTVYVFGQVVSPGHVLYKEGEGYKHYIERAGGMTNDARPGDVKVIKGGTRAWLDPGETSVEDGDLIWVPKDREFPFSYYVNTYAQIAGIIGTVATVALLINTFK